MIASRNRPSRLASLGRNVLRGVLFFVQFVLALWATLAIYYSNLPWAWARLVLALAFAVFSVWALWQTKKPWARLAFAVLLMGVLAWEVSIPPSHDRTWR